MSEEISITSRWYQKQHLLSERVAHLKKHLSAESQGKYLGRVLLIGNSNVGKSCILIALQGKTVPHLVHSTVAVDFFHGLQPMGPQLSLRVCDLPGQERYYTRSGVMSLYVQNTDVVVIVFDCTDLESFQNVPKWYGSFAERRIDLPPILLVCNKIDMKSERRVSTLSALECAEKYNMVYLEISTWSNENIDILGQTISTLAAEQRDVQSSRPHQTIKLRETNTKESKCC